MDLRSEESDSDYEPQEEKAQVEEQTENKIDKNKIKDL